MTVPAQNGGSRLYGPPEETPDRLTLQATLVLIAAALGLAFGVAVLAGGRTSRAKPAVERGPALVQRTPGSAVDPELTAAVAVPALRGVRKDREQLRRPTHVAGPSATPALTLVSAPVAPAESARPAPTAVAPYRPRAVATPKPTPVPTPAATPESSGDFDTTGEAAPDDTQDPNRTSGSVTK